VLARFWPIRSVAGAVVGSFPLCWRTGSIPLCWRLNHSMLPLETTGFSCSWLDDDSRRTHERLADPACGAQSLTDALVRHLEDLGGRVETGREVTELPLSDLVLADITPRQLLRIAGSHLSTDYRKQLERFRYGPGAFKIDYALNAAIPWTARECLRTATVHIEALSKRLLRLKGPFHPTNRSFCSASHRSRLQSSFLGSTYRVGLLSCS